MGDAKHLRFTSGGHWLGPCSGSLASSLSAARSLPKYSPVYNAQGFQFVGLAVRPKFLCATTLMSGDTSNSMQNCSVMLESVCGCHKTS